MTNTTQSDMTGQSNVLQFGKATAKGLMLIFGLVAAGYALRLAGTEHMFTVDWADKTIHAGTLSSVLIFLGLGGMFTGFGLPRQLVSFIAGYAFGVGWGVLLGLGSTLLGAGLTFFYARFVGRSLVQAKLGKRLGKADEMLRANPFTTILLIRFMPLGSNLVTNMVGGVSTIPATWFFLGSGLGFVPQTFIFALLGSGVQVDPVWRTVVSVALFLISSGLGVYLFRRYRMGRLLSES